MARLTHPGDRAGPRVRRGGREPVGALGRVCRTSSCPTSRASRSPSGFGATGGSTRRRRGACSPRSRWHARLRAPRGRRAPRPEAGERAARARRARSSTDSGAGARCSPTSASPRCRRTTRQAVPGTATGTPQLHVAGAARRRARDRRAERSVRAGRARLHAAHGAAAVPRGARCASSRRATCCSACRRSRRLAPRRADGARRRRSSGVSRRIPTGGGASGRELAAALERRAWVRLEAVDDRACAPR